MKEIISHSGGQLDIPVPPFNRHLAYKLQRKNNFLGLQPILAQGYVNGCRNANTSEAYTVAWSAPTAASAIMRLFTKFAWRNC